MAPHVSHIGVHDHGFNNVSTYGNLLRLMAEGRIPENIWERRFYEMALKVSGAVQAARWSRTAEGGGYIYSFNGPHSLFVDTIRTLRAPAVSHLLGHVLMGENDKKISLIERVAQHARATAKYAVWYGEGRDFYDVRGRTAHESVFNVNDGNYRCPNSQQGYSPFSTWTRGLLGMASPNNSNFSTPRRRPRRDDCHHGKAARHLRFHIENTPPDGIPYWDAGAPDSHSWATGGRPADPYNIHEPVDSSAAAIGAGCPPGHRHPRMIAIGRRASRFATLCSPSPI